MNIAKNMLELIGHTPLVKLNKLNKDGSADVIVKLEGKNPAGSVKDRPAYNMILEAEAAGLITPDTTIIEPTSGNMGIGLAFICAIKGYKLILTMPDTMSKERRQLLQAYGAKLFLTDGTRGMQGAVEKAKELNMAIKNSYMLQQFCNSANPAVHKKDTAEEIWNDTDGQVGIFVAGVGTGGTISGVGRGLKSKNKNIITVAVEPFSSQVLAGYSPAPHKIQGIGANFEPVNFYRKYVDEIMPITDESAIETCKRLAREEGILCGVSGGANVAAALKLAQNPKHKGKMIVTVLPDTGERYLSCDIFKEEILGKGA